MAINQITEKVQVTVQSTEDEIRQAVLSNSFVPMTKLFDRYSKTIESYKKSGYTIILQDIDKHYFVAEKKFKVDDNDE